MEICNGHSVIVLNLNCKSVFLQFFCCLHDFSILFLGHRHFDHLSQNEDSTQSAQESAFLQEAYGTTAVWA